MTAEDSPSEGRREEPPLSEEDRLALQRGVSEFNRGYYFECHDTLEDAWAGIRGPARDFFQGLIQVAVGFYHWRNGNLGGASTMLERAMGRLRPYPSTYCGLELALLREEILATLARVRAGDAFPADGEPQARYRLR